MARRKRYDDENPCPTRLETKDNGASADERRLTSSEAADYLGVQKRTLTRWWHRMRFPEHPEFTEAYEPDEEYKGDQLRLLWPVSVLDRIQILLERTDAVSGMPGFQRLPSVPWKSKATG